MSYQSFRSITDFSNYFSKSQAQFAGIRKLVRRVTRAISIRSMASVFLVICLLSVSTPAAPQTIVAVAKDASISLAFWYHSSGLAKLIQGQGIGNVKRQEKQSDRDAKVSRLQIFPGDVTIDVSDRVRFSAVAYDASGNGIGGAKVKWSAQGSESKRRVRISQRGELEAITPGSFTVTAQAGVVSAQVNVVVRSSARKNLSDTPTGTRQVSTRDVPASGIGSNSTKKSSGTRKDKSLAKQNGNGEVAMVRKAHAAKTVTVLPEAMPLLPGDGWDSTNYWAVDEPGNGVGNPPGSPLDGGAGSGNFQFAAPVLSLPGRDINISLGLAYNSRVWNKAGSDISYDNDRGWPAPGFNLGFGKMLGMGVYNGAMLVDADGTRHSYTGTITFYGWGTYGVMHTTDGSFIDYTYWTGTGGGMTWGQARLPNGTTINFGASSGHLYPTSIEDANGNYISITYVNNVGPRIQTINDTLNRTINFYYDYNNLLTAITAPGYNGGGARTLVRLHYHQLSLNYGFNNLTAHVSNPYPWVVDAIYYPGTNTGYWFWDSDSYSSYGMLAKIKEERNMVFSASSLTDMGSISEGSVTRTETYDYPLTPNYGLTDAPTYGSMTESWTRDGTNTDSATTYYSVDQISSPRTTTITLPNGTKSTQYSNNHPGQFDDGLIVSDETRDAANTLLQSSSSTWQPGAYDSPRPVRVTKTDERGQITAADFIYGSYYNQVIEVRDYDYGGSLLLRSTRTSYQNSSSYTNNHIFNLPLTVEVYAADNTTRVSRKDYQYDSQTLTDTPNVVMHDETHNPYAPLYEQCDCYEWDYWQIECLQWNCYWVGNYNSATDYRGNVTQVTTYADAAGATGAVTETRRYDITGNMVTASTSCCEQTTFNYTIDTQYAYPLSKTRGSATDPYAQVRTSASYDFNTGLGKTATDANNRTSTTDYDANTLRPTISVSPTGAHTDYAYDDPAMKVTQTTYLEAHPTHTTIADQNVKYLNGRGQVRQEKALSAGGAWDYVDTTYDNMGQVSQQTGPYRGGDPQFASTITYDALGRVNRVTTPDGSRTETYYNERDFDTSDSYIPTRPNVDSGQGETTLVRDAWGRERWGRTDPQGRLVAVVEPGPSGNGSVASNGMVTTYSYNTLGNLTQIIQDSQTRSFKYDSLGRLVAQKLAEASAMLNDAGTYVTTGGLWSDVFTYDERSNRTSRTDARGVKTIYSYNGDPLNRLQSVSWDTSGFGDSTNPIFPAGAVTYQYRQKANTNDLKDVTQVEVISTAAVSVPGYSTSGNVETFSYDSESRVSGKTLTFNNRLNYPFQTGYTYDSLDRAWKITYPSEYLNGGARKEVIQSYDIASRLSGLTYDSQSFASNIVYNAGSQTTSLSVGTGTYQVNESYTYSAQTGLLDRQTATRNGSTLIDLSYDYANASGKRTGQLIKITNNLYGGGTRDRSFNYDSLGRLVQVVGGPIVLPSWIQTYAYDRYGNRTSVNVSGSVPRDGLASVSYDVTSNRINTSGFDYDKTGNQTRALIPGSSTASQRFQYDAANRLVKVKSDDGQTVLATYTYGSSNERLIAEEGTLRTYYFGQGDSTIAEYAEIGGATIPAWSKSYVYLGNRLLSTLTPNGSGGEAIEHHHPDRLGTRVITNPLSGGWSEQVTLPFGTALAAESSGTPSNRRFTSYDRSGTTGLDYASNRRYDAQQGRFTQVDPIGMKSVDLNSPQTLNLYAYCANDPINHTDPSGLGFFKSLVRFFKTLVLTLVSVLVVIAIVVVAPIVLPFLAPILANVFVVALLGIVAQHFVLTVYNGISDEIREHGFSLGSLFRGLVKGLSRFLKSLVSPKGILGIAYYGNYCGAGNPNQSAGREPIDELDAACREHDRVYQDPNADSRDIARADLRLSLAAARAGLRGTLSETGNLFALFATVGFFFKGILGLLFSSGHKSTAQPTTITVSGNGGNRARFTVRSRDRYQMTMPAYGEIMNAVPQRIDRFSY